jgi:protein O-GlcNAc transferase
MDFATFADRAPRDFYAWHTLCAYPRDPLRYIEVLDAIQSMTTPSTMQLLNRAVRCMSPDEIYLEVGTWRGATLIGALLGNDATGIAIDNDSMNEHDKDERASADVWRENVARFGVADRATYVDASVPAVWKDDTLTRGRPVGVYFFDGDKSTPEAAYAGIAGVVRFLAPHALIIIDDANTPQIRQAAYLFCHRYHAHACKIIDLPTPANCWPSFWDGLIVIAWGAQLDEARD